MVDDPLHEALAEQAAFRGPSDWTVTWIIWPPPRACRGARGPAAHRLRRDAASNVARVDAALPGNALHGCLRMHDLIDRSRVLRQSEELVAPTDGERVAEVEHCAPLPDLAAAERDEVADQDLDHRAGEQQPPARRDRAPVAAEVDLFLVVRIRRERPGRRGAQIGHPAPELGDLAAGAAASRIRAYPVRNAHSPSVTSGEYLPSGNVQTCRRSAHRARRCAPRAWRSRRARR